MTEPELKPCPKCGSKAAIMRSGAGNKLSSRVRCSNYYCNQTTREFEITVPAVSISPDSYEDARNLVDQQAGEAWNAGRFLVTVEDLSINYERLSQAAENLGLFLALIDEGGLEPAEKVKRWDAIRREMRDSVRLIRKEVEYGA